MEDIHPLKTPIDVPYFTPWEWGILLFIASFIVFRVLYILWQAWRTRLKKRKESLPIYHYKDPFQEDLERLEELIDSEEFKLFSHEATELLKSFLSQKHQKNITDWTNTEILLFYRTYDDTKREELKTLFQMLDPVKYAGQKGERETATRSLNFLKHYVQGRGGN